jgi:hypothetical protein
MIAGEEDGAVGVYRFDVSSAGIEGHCIGHIGLIRRKKEEQGLFGAIDAVQA